MVEAGKEEMQNGFFFRGSGSFNFLTKGLMTFTISKGLMELGPTYKIPLEDLVDRHTF